LIIGFAFKFVLANNVPITDDPYYEKSVGDIESYAKTLYSTNHTIPGFTASKLRTTVGTTTDAQFYALYAGLMYCPTQLINEWTCKHCVKLGNSTNVVEIIDNAEFESRAIIFINTKRKEIHLSFRGSVNTKNWLENLKFTKTPFGTIKDAQVHQGFKNIADGMLSAYSTVLKNLYNQDQYKSYKLIITGHSAGGAVALISMLYLQSALDLPFKQIHVYTYGQPRVGNPAFINYLNTLPLYITRVVNENDLVPHTPPNYSNYYHYHTEIYINGQDSTICKINQIEDPNCSNSRVPFVSVEAHMKAWDVGLGSKACS